MTQEIKHLRIPLILAEQLEALESIDLKTSDGIRLYVVQLAQLMAGLHEPDMAKLLQNNDTLRNRYLDLLRSRVQTFVRKQSNQFNLLDWVGLLLQRNLLIHLNIQVDLQDAPPWARALLTAIFISVNDFERKFLQANFGSFPDEIQPILAVMILSETAILTESGEENRNWLIQRLDWIENLIVDRSLSANVVAGWMLSTYSTLQSKHNLKFAINDWIRKLNHSEARPVDQSTFDCHGSLGFQQVKGKISDLSGKPILAICAEAMSSSHAMFRWYGASILALTPKFHVVLIVDSNNVDESSKSMFDHLIEVKEETLNLQALMGFFLPDVVWFPSLGMKNWTVRLANCRWAELQLMSLGHPAESGINTIDAMIHNRRTFVQHRTYSENQLIVESAVPLPLIKGAGNLSDINGEKECQKLIKVAVPCHVMKLNAPYFQVLKQIQRDTKLPIKFSFYPNELGLADASNRRRITELMPDSVVLSRKAYSDYLASLAGHDFALSPFPFGNATSSMDCLFAGIPYVGLLGDDPSGRSDFDMAESLGLSNEFIAQSPKQYIQKAVDWANSTDLLARARALIPEALASYQNGALETHYISEFVSMFEWAWEQRFQLRNNRSQVFEGMYCWSVA